MSEHDPLCQDSEGTGDPTIAVALWNARSMVSELATKRWPKTN